MVTMGILLEGWRLRNAKAEGFGMLRTEAFCCRTSEFWLSFGFSYKEDTDVEEVGELMAIFSLAVADSDSKCRFCKSSELGFKSNGFGLLSC